MKRLALGSTTIVLLLSLAPTAVASTPRADAYYEVWCTTDGWVTEVQAESIDARSIELGGKDRAIALFTANNPFGMTCEARGPYTP